MNQDTTSLGKIVGLVKPTKTDALLKLTSLSYHHISSKAGASAAELIAELRLGICVALSTAVHTIAAQHTLSMLQVVDEEPLLARWNGEIHQDIIVRAIPSSLAIVSYLREILAIHIAIPFLDIDVILIQWLSVPVINGRHKRDANNQQHYDNQQYDIYLVHRSLVCLVYEMSSFNLICLFVIANNIQLKNALVKIGAQ